MMAIPMRRSGINAVGDVPWGTHLCQFYESKADLLDILVAYYKAGLEDNEFCMLVTSEALTSNDFLSIMRQAVPAFNDHLHKGDIEVVSYDEWYLKGDTFDMHDMRRVVHNWVEKLEHALQHGYAGMRVSVDTAWLEKVDWKVWPECEREIDKVIHDLRMMVLCPYALDHCGASTILEAVSLHQGALVRRQGHWVLVEHAELKEAKAALHRLNAQLEQRVSERTAQLKRANDRLKKAVEETNRLRHQLKQENAYLREEAVQELAFGEIVGHSEAMRRVMEQIDLVAPTDATVLILGETGTGKELVARAIHDRSRRRDRPLIKVNCGAVPRELFESEFFGHVKGAFTGALRDRVGRFQLAHEGTLFLDEVGEIPLELQPKLLRVLQDGEFERVGEDRTRRVAVRIIAATNRDLQHDVETGRFREDLFYRLSVFPIQVPPLRARRDDIPLLVAHFLQQACSRLHCGPVTYSADDIRQLQAYDWPGNVRELQNVIERAVIVSRGGPLRLDLVPPTHVPGRGPPPVPRRSPEPGVESVSEAEWRRQKRQNLLAALQQAGGKIYGPGGAAKLLGIKPTTLASRLKALGIKRPSRRRNKSV